MKPQLNVIKVGGKIVEDPSSLSTLLDAFCSMPGNKVLVHGGGRTATTVAASLGIETRMVDGRRITDKPVLDVVTMVYAGLVSKNVVASMQSRGVNAIGLSGADMSIILCDKRPVREVDYGFVGDVKKVDARPLAMLVDSGVVPVLCSITHDGKGQLLNTNADTIASSVAVALARHYDVTLTFCFENDGVLSRADDPASVIHSISRSEYASLVSSGVVSGGMIPKLDNAFAAIDAGVSRVVIENACKLGQNSGTTIV